MIKNNFQAKALLKRIEERDLYHCSWKVRIPKKMGVDADLDYEMVSARKESLWQALMSMHKLSFSESIYTFLEADKQNTFSIPDLWVPVCYYVMKQQCMHYQKYNMAD